MYTDTYSTLSIGVDARLYPDADLALPVDIRRGLHPHTHNLRSSRRLGLHTDPHAGRQSNHWRWRRVRPAGVVDHRGDYRRIDRVVHLVPFALHGWGLAAGR